MKRLGKVSLFAMICLLSPSRLLAVSAGGTASGGGELIKDKDNPWFLENTKQVHYCIAMDEENFHQSREKADALIKKAFAYWKREFAQALKPAYEPIGSIQVANQEFVETDCQDNPDLRFQMGILNKTQRQQITDPREFVAVSVREAYDTVNMRGKGFIYVAADSGPLKPNEAEIVERPWEIENGRALYRVLVHELGHVFGIPHTGGRYELMGSGYPEYVVSPDSLRVEENYHYPDVPNFFRYDGVSTDSMGVCYQDHIGHGAADFFGTHANWKCLTTAVKGNVVRIYGSDAMGSPAKTLVGEITLAKASSAENLGFMGNLYLPKEQKVFAGVEWLGRHVFNVASVIEDRPGTYHAADGQATREVFVTLSPNTQSLAIRGIQDGKLIINALF